jgi:hypothetical protein
LTHLLSSRIYQHTIKCTIYLSPGFSIIDGNLTHNFISGDDGSASAAAARDSQRATFLRFSSSSGHTHYDRTAVGSPAPRNMANSMTMPLLVLLPLLICWGLSMGWLLLDSRQGTSWPRQRGLRSPNSEPLHDEQATRLRRRRQTSGGRRSNRRDPN